MPRGNLTETSHYPALRNIMPTNFFQLRLLLLTIALTCLVITAGCGSSKVEENMVQQVLQARAKALNEHDMNLYFTLISAAYNDKGKDLAQLKEGLENGFKTYEKINYQTNERKIRIRDKKAEVSGSYRMRVVIRGNELVLDGKERLLLVKEPAGWKITAGL